MTGRRNFLGLGAAATLGAATPFKFARGAGNDTLLFALGTFPATLRPFASSGNSGNGIKLMIHRMLTSYTPQGELQPELATWTQPSDTEYVFELREAYFHNGDPVTAADVAYSLNEIIAENSSAFMKRSLEDIQKIEVLGPRKVRVVLQQPTATFLDLLATPFVPIISAKSASAPPEDPIGCGPFMIANRIRGEGFVLKRFAKYYKPGLPKIETIRATFYADESLRTAAIENGDVDIIEAVPWQSITGLQGKSNVKLELGQGGYYYLLFNFTTGRFTDPRVRQAVGLAVDRQAVTNAAFYGHGRPLGGLPIPDGPAFSVAMAREPFTQDMAKARKLMVEAGYPNGFSVNMPSMSNVSGFQRAGQVVKENLAQIGIEVNLVLADYARYTTSCNRGQYEFAVYGATGIYNDPDAISSMLIGPPSYLRSFGYRSPRVEALLSKGRGELNPARRREIYAELQQACGEEGPLIGLSWRAQGYAMKPSLKGFVNMPYFLSVYSPILMESATIG